MTDMRVYEERRRIIDEGRTHPGGWSFERLREWGVPIPPPVGWRVHMILTGIPYNADAVWQRPIDIGDDPSQDGKAEAKCGDTNETED